MSGDGADLAFAMMNTAEQANQSGTVLEREVQPLVRGAGAPVAVSVDAGRFAILNRNGTIDLRTDRGELAGTIQDPDATAVALRANRVVVLTRSGRLQVFAAATQEKRSDWAAPAGVSSHVDVQFGVAVLTAGKKVFAVSLKTGRPILVATAPGAVSAEIEPPGIAYSYNTGAGGHVRFIRFAKVERALR